jgi:3-methyladenine DNA glycosylase AlkD
MMSLLINDIRKELKKLSDKKLQQSSQNFFKEPIQCYGIRSAVVQGVAKKYLSRLKEENKETVFALCEELWKSGFIEESFIACEWAYSQRKCSAPEDFKIFESWIKTYVTNWASCDTFCNHTVGELLTKYPELLQRSMKWTTSKNRWMRRAAAVTLIVPARAGKFLPEILEIATILLEDQDDLVQKGYGWMLKAASQAHQKQVFDFVMSKKVIMPRTALRYAIEKMPKEQKEKAMKK